MSFETFKVRTFGKNVNDHEIEQAKALFKEIDANGNNFLDEEEYNQFLFKLEEMRQLKECRELYEKSKAGKKGIAGAIDKALG